VRENVLSDPASVTEESYRPYLDGRGVGWVAERDGAPLGFAMLDLEQKRVWALFVDPQAEGTGIGTALVAEIRAFAAAHRLDRLHLATGAGTRAARFYERLGWKPAGLAENGDVEYIWDMFGAAD
jgi:GNAT superfamily N-acetyltransferase